MAMPLQPRLDSLRGTAMSEAAQRARDALVRRLQRAGSAEGCLKIGDAFPPFLLPEAEGALVASDQLLAQGPLVVSFFRGDWCPFCSAMLQALQAALPEIAAAGGRLVALTPDTAGYPLAAKRSLGLTFPILSDVDSAVAMQCGVVFRAPVETRSMLLSYGVDLPARHGNDSWFVPIPATFVVGRDGLVRYAFADPDFTQRAEPAAIIAALAALG
jgi:peroxiredoxin